MSEPSERIHAALNRFKTARAAAEGQVESTAPGQSALPLVVIDEQNLKAVFLSGDGQRHQKAPGRKLAATNSR